MRARTEADRSHRARARSGLRLWRLVCYGLALSIVTSGGIAAPPASAHVESNVDGFETEEVLGEDRRTQAARRRFAARRVGPRARSVLVAPAAVETALALRAAAPIARESGRLLRHRHESLLV